MSVIPVGFKMSYRHTVSQTHMRAEINGEVIVTRPLLWALLQYICYIFLGISEEMPFSPEDTFPYGMWCQLTKMSLYQTTWPFSFPYLYPLKNNILTINTLMQSKSTIIFAHWSDLTSIFLLLSCLELKYAEVILKDFCFFLVSLNILFLLQENT